MRYHCTCFVLRFIVFFVISASLCSKEPTRISIMFTALHYPDLLKHGGYYYLLSEMDSVRINDYTPSEYIVFLDEGDTLFLACWKDTASDDTMQLEIYVDGMPEIEKGLFFWPEVVFEYRYPPIGVE